MVDQNILRFEVSMKDPFGVNVCNSTEYFFDDDLNFILIDLVIFACEKLLQVVIVIIKNYLE